MEATRAVVLAVRVARALVDVVVGFISLTADGRLTMGGLLGRDLPVSQHVLFHGTYTNAIQARGYVRKS